MKKFTSTSAAVSQIILSQIFAARALREAKKSLKTSPLAFIESNDFDFKAASKMGGSLRWESCIYMLQANN